MFEIPLKGKIKSTLCVYYNTIYMYKIIYYTCILYYNIDKYNTILYLYYTIV